MSGREGADAAGAKPSQMTARAMTARASSLPHTEEEILAVRIGAPTPDDGVIVIADYDPEWPRLYEREETRIRAALGDRPQLLEHAGSTSVPALAPNPRFALILRAPHPASQPTYSPPL